MKAKYYMGTASLVERGQFPTYDTLEEAVAAATGFVDKEKQPRFIVKTVALVEPVPPPVKVTLVDE